MKCQGQSSRLPFPYSWGSERKCDSRANGLQVRSNVVLQRRAPGQTVGTLPRGSPPQTNRATHRNALCISPPVHCALVLPFPQLHLPPGETLPPPRLSSNTVFFMKLPRLPCRKQHCLTLSSRSTSFVPSYYIRQMLIWGMNLFSASSLPYPERSWSQELLLIPCSTL